MEKQTVMRNKCQSIRFHASVEDGDVMCVAVGAESERVKESVSSFVFSAHPLMKRLEWRYLLRQA